MTDKEKIKAEIKRQIAELTPTKEKIGIVGGAAVKRHLESILSFIDSMQEEPVPKVFEDMLNAETAAGSLGISPEEHDKIVDECLYGKEPEFVDVDDLLNKKEEPISEELEKAADDALNNVLNTHEIVNIRSCLEMFRFGAQWQQEQFEKERLKHCDALTEEQAQIESDFVIQHLKENKRTPTFIDAIEYGMQFMKEQMMKDAIDAVVDIEASVYPYIPQIELYDYDKDVPLAKEGDKYKVILVKGD